MGSMKFDGRLSGGSFGRDKAASNAFRRDAGLLFVVGKLRVQEHLIRGANGRFLPEVQHRLANAYRVLGEQLQDAIAQKLDDVRVPSRRGVATGRLQAAIKDPENYVPAPGGSQFGFGVMNFDFLDHSQAKYWRAIEVGTSHFVGKKIRGIWGESLTGQFKVSPWNPEPGYPIAGPPYTTFGANRSGRLLPGNTDVSREFRKAAYGRMRESGKSVKEARNLRGVGMSGIIEEPIRAHRYAIGAWEEFGMRDKVEQAFMAAFYGSIPSRAMIEFDYGLRDARPTGKSGGFRGSIA